MVRRTARTSSTRKCSTEDHVPSCREAMRVKLHHKATETSRPRRRTPQRNNLMPQPDHISRLGVPDPATLDDDLRAIWRKCVDKLGFVPNVFSTYSLKPQRLRNFMAAYNEIMLSD